jgi:hypothetical protein
MTHPSALTISLCILISTAANGYDRLLTRIRTGDIGNVQAQMLMRSWVASGGSDANPCTREAACATFSAALAKTAAGGEIDVVDAGSYGAVALTKSITINGGGLGTINVPSSATGVFVSVGANDVVVLRNLDLVGSGGGNTGVDYVVGRQVVMDNVHIANITNGVIAEQGSSARNMVVHSSTITGDQFSAAVEAYGGVVTVSHTVIAGHDTGLLAQLAGVINADSNVLTGNNIAVDAADASTTIRLSNNDVYGNRTGFVCGAGTLLSAGNNRKGNNVGGTNASCAPNGPITTQ